MYLMYVDESGDCGMRNSPSQYFVLTGLVVHEVRWMESLERLIAFRRRMKTAFGLKLREEIHTAHLISRPGALARIKKSDRLTIIRSFADELASMTDLNLINVVVKKDGKNDEFDVFETAWSRLIQRFENTLNYKNFPSPKHPDERGMLIPDHTDDKKLTRLLRRMRRYNYVPYKAGSTSSASSRNLTVSKIVEDPSFRHSDQSLFLQATDLAAYLLYQHLSPNSYMRAKGGKAYFNRLGPILCRKASSTDPNGIVWV